MRCGNALLELTVSIAVVGYDSPLMMSLRAPSRSEDRPLVDRERVQRTRLPWRTPKIAREADFRFRLKTRCAMRNLRQDRSAKKLTELHHAPLMA